MHGYLWACRSSTVYMNKAVVKVGFHYSSSLISRTLPAAAAAAAASDTHRPEQSGSVPVDESVFWGTAPGGSCLGCGAAGLPVSPAVGARNRQRSSVVAHQHLPALRAPRPAARLGGDAQLEALGVEGERGRGLWRTSCRWTLSMVRKDTWGRERSVWRLSKQEKSQTVSYEADQNRLCLTDKK